MCSELGGICFLDVQMYNFVNWGVVNCFGQTIRGSTAVTEQTLEIKKTEGYGRNGKDLP